MELLLHLMTGHFDRCADKLEVFSLSLAMVEVDFWCLLGLEVIKHARWIQLYLSMTVHINAVSAFPRFSTRYFGICKFFLRSGIAVLGRKIWSKFEPFCCYKPVTQIYISQHLNLVSRF